MQKIYTQNKRSISGGIAATTLFCLIGLGVGLINIIGASIAGAKNIEAAAKQKPIEEPICTNSVFTNTYSSRIY